MPRITRGVSGLLSLAAWFGLAAGVVEAVISLGLRRAGVPVRVPAEILWIAPVVDLALFLIIGVVLTLLVRALPASMRSHAVFLTFLWVLAYIVLEIFDVMRPWAVLVLSLGVAVEGSRRLSSSDRGIHAMARTFVSLLVAAAVLVSTGIVWAPLHERTAKSRLPPPVPGTPNVLFITLDTLRADHVSAYGYSRPTTPNLDRVAQQGVLFENAFSNASWTLPSHASMLTGRYPHDHRADWRQPMNADVPTLTELFAGKGYATAAFAANTSYVSPEWGLGRGFTRFDVYGGSIADDVVRTVFGRRLALNILPRVGYLDIPGRKRAARLDDDFLKWLEGIDSRPFFALLNFLDAHDPYLTAEPFHSMYSPTPARGDVINFQFQPDRFRRKPKPTAAEIQAEIDGYDGCVTYLDAQLGRLFSELARRGLDRNTFVIVSSDHGESFGNHDLFGHGNALYFETVHVPLVVAWPGHVPAGRRVSAVVGLDRLPATIEQLIDPSSGRRSFPGRSLASAWSATGARDAGETGVPVLSEVTGLPGGPPGYPTSRGSLRSLISRDWHMILSSSGETELFAWPDDPEERTNLAATERGRAAVAALTRTINEMGAGSAAK
jgi:arylsulfatase A-like enzyme